MIRFFVVFIFFSLKAYSSEFCHRNQDDIKQALSDQNSRISFKNDGGLINGGVCWWHSRLQRNSVYLVKFDPELPPPTKKMLPGILRSLKEMDRVVTIPGYSNFETFSRDYQKEIQSMLNVWQKSDGFFNFQWIRGISGYSKLSANSMQLRLNAIFKHHQASPMPVWIMAQMKGITSHSFLILDMMRTEDGYELSVIDSNNPIITKRIDYHKGDTSLYLSGENKAFVPYIGFQNDFKKISKALKNECDQLDQSLNLDRIKTGEIEL